MRRACGLAEYEIFRSRRARRAGLCRCHDARYCRTRCRLCAAEAPFQRPSDRRIDRARRQLQHERARSARPRARPRAGMTKAFRFHRHGGPEVLRYEDVDLGEPGRGQVRIRNTAVAVNFRDVLMRRGTHAVKSFPSGIGLESAGVIDAIGPDVTGFSLGERVVYAGMPEGSYAEARIVPAARLIALPPEMDDRTAAAMMIRGMTARCLLHETYKVSPGDTVLIHAAAGGVGLIMCQWAKHLGATVIGTVGTD